MPEQELVASEFGFLEPMLCKVYNPEKDENRIFNGMWAIEPKLDGLRGLIICPGMGQTPFAVSRNGKQLWNIQHILDSLKDYSCVIDGEFYFQDWNTSMSILKTQTAHPLTLNMKFHAWDFLTLLEVKGGGSTRTLASRRADLRVAIGGMSHVKMVKQIQVETRSDLDRAYGLLLEEGYEGGVLKNLFGFYAFGKRSKEWLKVKPWHDCDLPIVGAVEGNGKNANMLGALQLEGLTEVGGVPMHVKTEVGTGFDDATRIALWTLYQGGDLIGRVAEIKYQEATNDSLRFPVFHRLRDDK